MFETITIPVDGAELPAAVSGPDDRGAEGPALVVIPSIFGPAPDLLERLEPVARGALVVVPDPFWRTGEGALPYDQLEPAIERLAEFDFDRCGAEMAAAVAWAREHSNGHVVAVGICFGGPYTLRLASRGLVDGIVTWHGSRMEQSLDLAGTITCPVRHHLGSADPVSPPEVIEAIEDAFAHHRDARIIVHEGATHGFSHDGDAWDPTAFAAGLGSVTELLGRGD